jgi:hypothetical protein
VFFLGLLALALAQCGFVRDQFDATNMNGCIKKNCSDSEASAYQNCQAACRRAYSR